MRYPMWYRPKIESRETTVTLLGVVDVVDMLLVDLPPPD